MMYLHFRRMLRKLWMRTRSAVFAAGVVATAVVFIYLFRIRDWTAIAALAALFAAVAAFYQTYISRFSLGVDLILKLDERFEADEFREKRRDAACGLRAPDGRSEKNLEDVLDFFETLGLLVRRKALDEELVWSTFFYVVYGYSLYGKTYIERQIEQYPTRYHELRTLTERLAIIEKHNEGTLDKSEWDEFLDEEAAGYENKEQSKLDGEV